MTAMTTTDIVGLDAVKAACGITEQQDDLWIAGVVAAVSEAVEAVTGRWLAPRPSATYLFDAARDPFALEVPRGIASCTYLGYATTDQPDDASGTYLAIPAAAYYLDPPAQDRRAGEPAHRIVLSRMGGYYLPTWWQKRCIKVTGVLGGTSPRASQIAAQATVRAFRARAGGGADYAIVGPDGGMKVLRDFAPAELEELRGMGVPTVR